MSKRKHPEHLRNRLARIIADIYSVDGKTAKMLAEHAAKGSKITGLPNTKENEQTNQSAYFDSMEWLNE